jgi:hypothetical protein
MAYIIRGQEDSRSQGIRIEEKHNMKHAVRMMILMVGLACTYAMIAAPMTSAEVGPMPTCNPNTGCGQQGK